jgi:hypothetical protein
MAPAPAQELSFFQGTAPGQIVIPLDEPKMANSPSILYKVRRGAPRQLRVGHGAMQTPPTSLGSLGTKHGQR